MAIFAREHWERAPLLSRAADLTGPFVDLLSADAVDEMVTGRGLRLPFFRMVRDGETLPAAAVTRSVMSGDRRIGDMADPDRIREHFTEGATLVLQSLHRSHPPLVRFCRELADQLGHPTQCNAYVTPPGSQGFAPHHDTHDVFVLQVDGCKRWNVYPPVHLLPLADQSGVGRDETGRLLAEDAAPLISVELQPGDSLYLPRGYVHAAETAEDRSIHLTVGVLVHRWHDVLRDLVTLAGEDVEFRRALPLPVAADAADVDEQIARLDLAGFLRRSAEWIERTDPDSLAAFVRERLRRGRPPEPLGPLAAQRGVGECDADTRVRLRQGLSWTLAPDADPERVVLRLADRDISWPRATETALRLALSGAAVCAAELCALTAASCAPSSAQQEPLDVAGCVVLVRRLLREGALIPLAGP